MKALIDHNCLQALVHLRVVPYAPSGYTLRGFLEVFDEIGVGYSFSETAEFVRDYWDKQDDEEDQKLISKLGECDLFVQTTRYPRLPETSDAVLDALGEFVDSGGWLISMTNHSWPNERVPLPDQPVFKRFGFEIREPVVLDWTKLITLDGDLIMAHEATNSVESLVFRNCTPFIAPDDAEILVHLPEEHANGRVFAATRRWGSGQIVMVADSGFITTQTPSWSGLGLIQEASNREFVAGLLRWATRSR